MESVRDEDWMCEGEALEIAIPVSMRGLNLAGLFLEAHSFGNRDAAKLIMASQLEILMPMGSA